MAGDDPKPDAAKPSDVAEALKNTRTSALKALNKAAAQLDVAIAKDQFSVTSDLGKLETAWKDVDASHKAFVQCVTENSLDNTLLTVNGKSADVWFSDAEKVYDTHVQMYKQHISSNTSSFSPISQQHVSSPQFVPKSHLNFQRQEFPTWDGSAGKQWLEWKSAWQTEVEPYFGTKKLALAAQLRKCVKGEGIKEIQHVSLTDSKAYDTMWKALTDRFDNVALNIGVILAEFDSLKPVDNNKDHVGLLALIRSVSSAYEQLNTLGHVQQVDSFRVNALNSKLPFYLQEGWAEKFAAMSSTERFHPFKQFVEFLKSKVDVVKAMVDIANPSPSQVSSRNKSSKPAARVNVVAAGVNSCAIHPEQSSHSLAQCGAFKRMSAEDRAKLCTSKGVCKRCLQEAHRGTPCSSGQDCGYCTSDRAKRSHCELLCFRKDKGKGGKESSNEVKKPYGQASGNKFGPPPSGNTNNLSGNTADSYGNDSQKSEPHNVHPMYSNGSPFYSYPNPWVFPYMTMGPAPVNNPNQQFVPQYGSPYQMSMPPVLIPGFNSHYNILPHQAGGDGMNGSVQNISRNNIEVQSNAQNQGAHVEQSSGSIANNGSTQSTTGPSQQKAGIKCVSMSTNLFNVSHQSDLKELPKYDNILSVPRDVAFGIYAIFSVSVSSSNKKATVFADDGSDCVLFTEAGVKKLNGRLVATGSMDITTVQGTSTEERTEMYEIPLIDVRGVVHHVVGYTVPRLCGKPYQLNESILKQLFPEHDPKTLQRPKQAVDVLLGSDYFSLHPKVELASDGANLSVMSGLLGICVQGSHHSLVQGTSSNPFAGATTLFKPDFVSVHKNSIRLDTPIFRTVNVLTQSVHPVFQSGEKALPPECLEASHAANPVPEHHNTTAPGATPRSSPESPSSIPATWRSVSPSSSSDDTGLVADVAPSGPEDPLSGVEGSPIGVSSTTSPDPASRSKKGRSTVSPSKGSAAAGPGAGVASLPAPLLTRSRVSAPIFNVSKGAFGEAIDRYILGEQLGTMCDPRCGGCRCGKCPLKGHDYSFKEEQELQLIQSKLRYVPDPGYWITGYPWVVDPWTLPDNYAAAYSTLCRTEKALEKDLAWKEVYGAQLKEHEERGVARKLSQEEVRSWDGPYFYISHMQLEQPKSESTPVRVVFNSSQKYKGVSLNSSLAKGPDCYNNNLLGMLIRFRENPIVMIGDIKKMYNTVHLESMEQHMHRFLWRDCDPTRKPDIWVITRVNLGDKPSGTIAITAKNNTAHMFSHICPEAAQMLIYCCYTDDIINSIKGEFSDALKLAEKCELILSKGSFKVKGWSFGGRGVPEQDLCEKDKQVLGTFYSAKRDVIFFPTKLNFSKKRRNVPTGPNLRKEDLPEGIPNDLTRRIVLASVMAIYDPLGLLSPLVLKAKLLLRSTWQLKLEWDEPLCAAMVAEWKRFFADLFEAEEIPFERCLTPEGAVGKPSLILMSDGSEEAYGCVAYIRWQLEDNSYWCHIIMAKSRISPINRVNIPQMELNGAVISKRLREVIISESRFEFDKIHHIIDSETVLCQLYKVASKFKVFEGVRIGEIQGATDGDMSDWAWVAGTSNVGDLTTRPQSPSALGPDSVWQKGPDFLYLPEEQWPVKRDPQVNLDEFSPGEKAFSNVSHLSQFCSTHERPHDFSIISGCLKRCSRTGVMFGGLARVFSAFECKSFRGVNSKAVTPDHRRKALLIMLQDVQCEAWKSRKEVQKHFRHINPVMHQALWTVGSRDPRLKILTPDHEPQVLLPPKHELTYRIVRDAHTFGRHGGRDATVARFRAKYHTSRVHKIAAAVCAKCHACKLIKVKLLEQQMGSLPPERFYPSPPFDSCVLDLFGPYLIRGEVNKRASSKVWGVIFVDLVSRAVHIEISTGYDSKNFLLSFRRFAALRGWPSVVYSDPGTQLVGASAEITAAWDALNDDGIVTKLSQNGTRWVFGPADSPWYQGAAEALIKSAKSAVNMALRDTHKGSRLSLAELLTVFTEAANLLNERPIGFKPSIDNPITILTPNSLLLGRSFSVNPGNFDSSLSLFSRLTLVNDVVNTFWHNWTQLYAPTLIKQTKWLRESRPLQEGDIVLVADSNVMRGEYRIGKVHKVHPSKDGLIRRASVKYMIYKTMSKDMKLSGGREVIVERSVQRLSILIPCTDEE